MQHSYVYIHIQIAYVNIIYNYADIQYDFVSNVYIVLSHVNIVMSHVGIIYAVYRCRSMPQYNAVYVISFISSNFNLVV